MNDSHSGATVVDNGNNAQFDTAIIDSDIDENGALIMAAMM